MQNEQHHSLHCRGAELARDLGGDTAVFAACDVSKEEDVIAAVQAAVKAFDGFDIAINNAGQQWRGELGVAVGLHSSAGLRSPVLHSAVRLHIELPGALAMNSSAAQAWAASRGGRG